MKNPTVSENEFAVLDQHFAQFICRIGGGDASLIRTVAASLSRAVREGHICLDLGKLGTRQSAYPQLLESSAIGTPDREAPLILDEAGRLYLRRYWLYENRLASLLRERAERNRLAKPNVHGNQEEAVAKAVSSELTVITGGPGTGKTTTVVAILRQLIEQSIGRSPRIALAAPTGKAATRLEETLRVGIAKLSAPDEVKEKIPCKASTIHRLLGRWRGGAKFFYDRKNPLPLDVLIVDEASMVALPLMTKLFDALPASCKVVLLGDRDQLSSVDPGAVLADIVDSAAKKGSALAGSVILLSQNFRFNEESGIYRCSNSVRTGATDEVLEILRQQDIKGVRGVTHPAGKEFQRKLKESVTGGFANALKAPDPATALKEFAGFRVLCALRRGPFGVTGLNRRIEEHLLEAGLIPAGSDGAYRGQPILVTQNDHQLQLYNGDIGVLFPDLADDSDSSRLWAWFVGPDGSPRKFSRTRLPEHAVAYAMTVHKAQGSEFDDVLFILPDRDSAVLSRELIYTGITRARNSVEIWFNEEVLRAAITRRAVRYSGLADALLRDTLKKC